MGHNWYIMYISSSFFEKYEAELLRNERTSKTSISGKFEVPSASKNYPKMHRPQVWRICCP